MAVWHDMLEMFIMQRSAGDIERATKNHALDQSGRFLPDLHGEDRRSLSDQCFE